MNMFTNLFTGSTWLGNTGPVDTSGYPLSIPNSTSGGSIEAGLSFFQENCWPDSVYVVRWDGAGAAQITTWGAVTLTTLSSDTGVNGRIVFKVTYGAPWSASDQYQVKLHISSSRASNHIRNVRFYLASNETAYESQGQVLNPKYLQKIQPFYMLRFMGMFNTNGTTLQTWSQRTTKSWYNQSGGQYNAGLAYEWACQLCNASMKNMWFNIPAEADNNAIQNMAQLVYSQLNPNLDVFIEYSNETWNWAFPQFFWILDYANNFLGGNSAKANAVLSVNAFRIWRQVFGKDSLRIRRVMSGHPYGCLQPCGDGLSAKLNYMSLNDFDVVAGAYYWGPATNVQESWTSTTQAISAIKASIESNANGSWYASMVSDCNYAHQLGKEFYCYEGGFGTDPTSYTNYAKWDTVAALQTISPSWRSGNRGFRFVAKYGG